MKFMGGAKPLSSNSRYGYKWQCGINISSTRETYARLNFKNKLENAKCEFSVVDSHFWKTTCYDLTIKCLDFYKLKYAICETKIQLVC